MGSIIGTWELISFEIIKDNKINIKPFGNEVKGLVIYQENGYMSGIISGEGRSNVSSTATLGLSEEERGKISKNFIAYAGKYQIHDDIIIHNVMVSFIPNLMNEESHKNSFVINEDNLVTISRPQSLSNKNISIVLNWKKIG